MPGWVLAHDLLILFLGDFRACQLERGRNANRMRWRFWRHIISRSWIRSPHDKLARRNLHELHFDGILERRVNRLVVLGGGDGSLLLSHVGALLFFRR